MMNGCNHVRCVCGVGGGGVKPEWKLHHMNTKLNTKYNYNIGTELMVNGCNHVGCVCGWVKPEWKLCHMNAW